MSSRYDELERLQRLREAGALTDEEFQAEKKRLLGGGPAPIPSVAFADEEESVEAEEDPEAEERRKRNILYAVIGTIGLLIAIGLGVWLGRDVSGGHSAPEANVSMPEQNAAAPAEDNMIVAAAAPTDIRTLPMPEQLGRAFAAAFGTADSASLQVGGRTINYRPGRLIWIADRAVLISPGTAGDDCHACAGTLAVHYLQPEGDGFKVTGSWPDAVAGSGWGAAPKWKLTSAFTNFPAIYEEGGYTGQGCTSAGVTITELAPQGPVQSGPIRTLYSNAGATAEAQDPGEIEGTITNVQKDQSFDVAYSGAQPITEHWAKTGARFVLQGGETRMPQC